jgi:uncharacterized membrane protein HdeD (DUF308 family)
MIRALIRNWWLLLLRGAFALAFAALILLFKPLFPSLLLKPMAYTAVAVTFGVLALATGIITVLAALKSRAHWRDVFILLAEGLTVTAGGLTVILVPAITIVQVIQIIAATSFAVGVLELIIAIRVRRHVRYEWFLIAGGVTSIAFAVWLTLNPSQEIPTLLDWVAFFAATNGIVMAGLAYRVRGLRHEIHELSSPDHLRKKAGAA